MKTKKSVSIIISFITIAFLILYFFFAAKPLGKEYLYNPEWTINLNSSVNPNFSDDEKIAGFKLGQSIGYFTDSGKLIYLNSYPNKATISDKYFSTYNTQANLTSFYDFKGNEKGKVNSTGFPAIYENRIYVFLPGGSSYTACDESGNRKWINENVIPITAFASIDKYTTSGYADGSIRLIDNSDGTTVYEYEPDGSDYTIILGLDISPDGKYIASISGKNKQRFVVCQNDNNKPKIIFHTYLDEQTNKRSLIKFSKDGEFVYFNYEGGLGIYSVNKNKLVKKITLPQRIINLQENDDFIFLLTLGNNTYTVYLLEKSFVMQGHFSFQAESAFIKTMDNILYVGKDNTISKLNIKRE